MNTTLNPATCLDSYKLDHRRQYPPGTELVVSNLTPRSGKHANVPDKGHVVFVGLQYFMAEYLQKAWNDGFFHLIKQPVVDAYRRRVDRMLGAGAVPVDHIEALHDLGYLPIEIRALEEGSVVPVGTPVLTIHNTRPEFFWLTNYLETVLSCYLWQPCTSATTAMAYCRLLQEFGNKTGVAGSFLDFQAHDFSMRGMSSLQSAMTSGMGQLVFFKGTDTVPAIDLVEEYYGGEVEAYSVPATEHSVMSLGGEGNELETFRRLIQDVYPSGIVSIVSDTWDFHRVISDYAFQLRDTIMSRDGKLTFRPDSGDPVKILCGDPSTPFDPSGPEAKGAVEVLWDIFGGSYTSTGHKQLDPHVGLIYGDSITYERAKEILQRLEAKGFSSGNVVFGVGSWTYQHVTRDTWGWAMKATYGQVNGEGRELFKNPKTDDGTKKSAKGLLAVRKGYVVKQGVSWEEFTGADNLLQPVFRDGSLVRRQTWNEVRENAFRGMWQTGEK